MQYLESRLEELKRSPHSHRSADPLPSNSNVATQQQSSDWDIDVSSNVASSNAILRIARTAVSPICAASVLQTIPKVYYGAKLFYASERPPLKIPLDGIYNEHPPRTASRGSSFHLPRMGSLKIPFNVAKTLFDNYMFKIFPRYPCFTESDLVGQFHEFYPDGKNPEQVYSDTTWFIVCMTLAISSLASKAQDFKKVASLIESLQRDAMRRSSFLAKTSFRSLQGLILLMQMAVILPYTSNLWYLSGEAMRMAIALGLHQEPEDYLQLGTAQINLRRCIFWTVRKYC